MGVSSPPIDLYAVLQVHPDADQEVVEAAYRQLMKKYHPDVAGTDLAQIALHHERAKAINQAYAVLRDPTRRRSYDAQRTVTGHAPAPQWPTSGPHQTTNPRPPTPPRAAAASPEEADQAEWVEPSDPSLGTAQRAPFGLLSTLYYMLPGPYEWEDGRGEELLTACLIPSLGLASFALASGRLASWIGHSFNTTLVAWAILGLLSIPTWRSLPGVAMASVPSALLMTGLLDPALRQASMPAWVAWVLMGVLSLILSARIYVFGILPSLALCWLLARLT